MKEGHATLSVNCHPGHIFDPVPLLERVGIQEGSLWHPTPWAYCSGVPSVELPFLEGSGLPSLVPSPLCGLNSIPFWLLSPAIPDEMMWSGAIVAVFLFLLCVLHCYGKAFHEFHCHTIEAIRILAISTFSLSAASSSRWASCTAGVLVGWVPFSFLNGKKLVILGLAGLSPVWPQDGSIVSSFSASCAACR